MAAITAAVVVGAGAAYSANRKASAAKDASKKQAEGVRNAQEISRQNADMAVDAIGDRYGSAEQYLSGGVTDVVGALTQGQDAARNALSGGYDAANDSLTGYFGNADSMLQDGFNAGINTLQPTAQQGGKASELQAALSGALGPDAQAEAFANYTASPGQEYLRDQQEQSLLRNSAALGGGLTANGRVMTALQDQAFGRAQTDYSNQFDRLGQIASRGDAASQSIAQLQASLGGARSNLQSSLGQLLAGYNAQEGQSLAQLESSGAANIANAHQTTATQLAQLLSGQGNAEANIRTGQGTEQAQLAQNLGQALSSYDIYRSQNDPWAVQGINAGIGAYTGMGGTFGGGGSNASMLAGSQQSGYNSPAYRQWLAQR